MDTDFGKQALEYKDLYERIVKHRSIYYSVGYVDYKPKALQGYCIEDTKQLTLF